MAAKVYVSGSYEGPCCRAKTKTGFVDLILQLAMRSAMKFTVRLLIRRTVADLRHDKTKRY